MTRSKRSLQIKNLSVSRQGKRESIDPLENFSLDINGGEIYAILGPSGCGKTTLLHVLSGIIPEFSGMVLIDGETLNPRKHSIGLVPQNYGLLPWKRVRQNIFLPEKIRGVPIDQDTADEVLSSLKLRHLLERYPHELSGGEQQRVALARSFIQKPDILLMDEPFSALDSLTSMQSRRLFLHTWETHRVTTLFVTHNVEEAVEIGTHVVLLANLPGRVIDVFSRATVEELREQINSLWV